jgi:hypothetical protein|tara:strand:+ start:128 stop:358 length:231 start_codon:yes stop_codon:yes gene_type:complete
MDMEDDTLKVDGFDDAIMGFAGRCGLNDVLLYSMKKIIKILRKRDGMSKDEALEYFYYNIKGSYMGEGTPLFFDDT